MTQKYKQHEITQNTFYSASSCILLEDEPNVPLYISENLKVSSTVLYGSIQVHHHLFKARLSKSAGKVISII